ncbi:MAG: Gfo/Idh/MocA family oxidoreductase [Ruminococcaceae bacterium]|nr:Gfo/Idh/MocA family oxidoreductase [Oscillospiraceae bacterium]
MNIAFAGFRHGHILGLYDSVLASDEVNLAGCFEENGAVREQMKADKGITFSYDSYDALLKDDSVDVVAIGDYYGIRGKRIIEALKAGKHVIADKPLCTDLDELEEIRVLTEQTGLKVCCMLDLRYMPQVGKVKEMVQSGSLGTIHIASFNGQHCLDYGVRPNWYFEDGKHGGTINDIAIHGIDLLRLITGENLTEVICARTWNAFATQEPGFHDCAQFMVKLGEIAVTADVSYAAPKCSEMLPSYWEFTLWGTKGMVRFCLKDGNLYVFRSEAETIPCGAWEPALLQDFLKELKGEPSLFCTSDVLEMQKQVLLIQKAAK